MAKRKHSKCNGTGFYSGKWGQTACERPCENGYVYEKTKCLPANGTRYCLRCARFIKRRDQVCKVQDWLKGESNDALADFRDFVYLGVATNRTKQVTREN